MDVLLQDRRVAATELRRVAGQQPAVVEHQTLPPARPLRYVTAGPRALDRIRFGRQMFVQEGDELGAEGLDVGVERQLHGTPEGRKLESLLLSTK
jgi:hypothetical protein